MNWLRVWDSKNGIIELQILVSILMLSTEVECSLILNSHHAEMSSDIKSIQGNLLIIKY